MPKPVKPPKVLVDSVKAALESETYRTLSARTRVHHATLRAVAGGKPVAPVTIERLGAVSWGKRKTAADYPLRPNVAAQPHKRQPSTAWPLSEIRAARDGQLRGDFRRAAPLADAMMLDDAIYTAADNRTAPINALPLRLASAGGVRGDRAAKLAGECITTPRAMLRGIGATIAMHNIAIGHITQHVDDEGSLVSMRVVEWPIQHVWWDEYRRTLMTTVDGGGTPVEIHHGDGEWIVFNNDAVDPWKKAAILPTALIFGSHIDAIRDWNASSRSHGQAKVVGQMLDGVPLSDEDGNLSQDAKMLLEMLSDLVSGDAGAGLIPAGAEAKFISNGSTAWQVFSELALNREKAAARVFLGTDGSLGSVGGAPGVDIAQLFGVATTKTQGDVQIIQDALYSGLYVPFTAMNLGDSKHAPRLEFVMPDADAERRVKQRSDARTAMLDAIERYRAAGLKVTQDVVNTLAADYGVEAPQLDDTPPAPDSAQPGA